MKTPASIRPVLTIASLATILIFLNPNTFAADKPPARAISPTAHSETSQIEQARIDLENLKAMYKEDHPLVKVQESKLKRMESVQLKHKTAYDLEIVDGVLTQSGREATLDNVIDALRERYSKANIVLSPGLKKVQILDLKLRTGSIWEELEAIRVASGGKFEWLGPNSPVFSGERTPNNPNNMSPSAFAGSASPGASGAVDPATGLPLSSSDLNAGLFILRERSEENERVV